MCNMHVSACIYVSVYKNQSQCKVYVSCIPFCFSYRMRRLQQQSATVCQQFASVCAVFTSKLLPHAPHTLAKCYRMRRIRQQFAAACAAYACKNSFLHDFASVCAVCASNLLAYAPLTLARCYRMRRIRQQSRSQANFAILTKSSLNHEKSEYSKKAILTHSSGPQGNLKQLFLF